MRSIFAALRFQELRSYLTTNLTLHFTIIPSIHLSTAQLEYSFFLSTCSVPSVVPMPFSNAIPVVFFIFCGVFTPIDIFLNCSLYALWAEYNTISKSTKNTKSQYWDSKSLLFVLCSINLNIRKLYTCYDKKMFTKITAIK